MKLTHIDNEGNSRMVDISEKKHSTREAVAEGRIYMNPGTILAIKEGKTPKGDVYAAARIAGIMAAKRTQELIPMCHQIPLDSVKVEINNEEGQNYIHIKASVKCTWKTGVEMEALTAVSVAALSLYDMCKAIDKEMIITDISLIKKSGGKSGDFIKTNNKGLI